MSKSGTIVREGRHRQQHTPCPGCVRNERYLEMTAIWEKCSRHKGRKINPRAFNKTHLKLANPSPLSLNSPRFRFVLGPLSFFFFKKQSYLNQLHNGGKYVFGDGKVVFSQLDWSFPEVCSWRCFCQVLWVTQPWLWPHDPELSANQNRAFHGMFSMRSDVTARHCKLPPRPLSLLFMLLKNPQTSDQNQIITRS